ncbi:MAG: YbjQ family protein [Gaiellaceae bacterium]
MILTTGPEVAGRPVQRYLDLVTAQAIMGVHIGKDITAGLRNIVGGRSKSYEGEVAKAVAQVMDELRAGGEKLAADAILSIDIDYETVGDNMLMVAASGTAVKLG